MEDEKNIDLSLGLLCGGSSSSVKNKPGSSSDNRLDDGDRDSKVINEFKNFLEGGIPVKSDNFYNFPKSAADLETSKNSISGGIWIANDSRATEIEEENRSALCEKRKSLFNDTNQQKKHERETNHPESETTHISITTDEGSTAENEDVADSEVDGLTSRQHDDVSKRVASSSNLSRAQNEIHAYGDRSGAEHLGPKRFNMSTEKDLNMMSMPYGVSFPVQSVNMANMSYSQPLKDNSTPSLSSYPLPGIMHAVVAANNERSGFQSVGPANFPLMFGYSPVQLPVLDKNNSHPVVSYHQQIPPIYPVRNQINSDVHNDNRKLTQEYGKNSGKQRVGEDGSSGYTQGELKGDRIIHQANDASDQHRTESFPSNFPAIRPGIAAELKFGGCGTYPNLPWVSTTGPGPNGRTISGVTYRYSPIQIRIVCACHGTHLSPEEFVRHAGEENIAQESRPGFASFPSSNPEASAQS